MEMLNQCISKVCDLTDSLFDTSCTISVLMGIFSNLSGIAGYKIGKLNY
jgi:hypothetical protein